jgi:hypothetical protein
MIVGSVLSFLMNEHKCDMLSVLRKSKPFILELKGDKTLIRQLCVTQFDILEASFDDVLPLDANGKCYESDADSNGNLRWATNTLIKCYK